MTASDWPNWIHDLRLSFIGSKLELSLLTRLSLAGHPARQIDHSPDPNPKSEPQEMVDHSRVWVAVRNHRRIPQDTSIQVSTAPNHSI